MGPYTSRIHNFVTKTETSDLPEGRSVMKGEDAHGQKYAFGR